MNSGVLPFEDAAGYVMVAAPGRGVANWDEDDHGQ